MLQEAQRINTSNFRKPSLLRVESLDTDLHEDHDHDELDGMSTPSSLSEDVRVPALPHEQMHSPS